MVHVIFWKVVRQDFAIQPVDWMEVRSPLLGVRSARIRDRPVIVYKDSLIAFPKLQRFVIDRLKAKLLLFWNGRAPFSRPVRRSRVSLASNQGLGKQHRKASAS